MINGDSKARETLIRSNLRYAIREAGKYQYKGLDYEDLISIAVSGLINGINHFKPEMNTRIITCASWWIRAEFKTFYDKKEKEKEYKVSEIICTETMENYIDSLPDTDSMSPEDSAVQSCFRDSFYKSVKKIPAVERTVFLMYRGFCGYSKKSLSEIGEQFGKTKQWAWNKSQTAEQFIAKNMDEWIA
jgi:RNA polymerase primary sigma factor